MDTPDVFPPALPSDFPGGKRSGPPSRPLGEAPEDQEPVTGPLGAVEALLRHPRRIVYQLRLARGARLAGFLVLVTIFCALVYGVVVGSFSRGTQWWAAPVKISLGFLASGLICLPSLYIFSCLSGSQARFREVIGLLTGLMALATVLLIGFAPVAWVFSQSTTSVSLMGGLHLAFWPIASYFGVRFLVQGFRHLHTAMDGNLRVWVGIFIVVALQMMTTLRPIVGTSSDFLQSEKKFFVTHWLECLAAPRQDTLHR